MKLAIIGSAHSQYHHARVCLDSLHRALIGVGNTDVHVGTFLRGGVHTYAGDLAHAMGWSLRRFHSAQVMLRWAPDMAIIVWDGRSRGCIACHDLLTRDHVPTTVTLLRDDGSFSFLGSNHDLLPLRTPTIPQADETEALWAHAT